MEHHDRGFEHLHLAVTPDDDLAGLALLEPVMGLCLRPFGGEQGGHRGDLGRTGHGLGAARQRADLLFTCREVLSAVVRVEVARGQHSRHARDLSGGRREDLAVRRRVAVRRPDDSRRDHRCSNAVAPMAVTRMNNEMFFGGAAEDNDSWIAERGRISSVPTSRLTQQ
ncbi:hypothetical protein ABZ863_13820 [Saccharomonospora sp. NPDC046836]|uniref:hypothetical protein n=1 Tax=Saccharomonospora sp. NPDC046836 TaxID=3156921 RepID=UPI0034100829